MSRLTSNVAPQVRGQCGISFYPLKVGDPALIDTNGGGCVGHVGAVTSWSKEEITYIANFKNISC